MSHLNLLTFSTDFCPIKYDLSGDTAWTQASGFQKLAKVTIFNELLSTQNVNVARFARNMSKTFLWFSNTVILLALAKNGPENSFNLSGNAHCVHDKNTWKDQSKK